MFKEMFEAKNTNGKNKGIFTKEHLEDADKGIETPETLETPTKKEVSQVNENTITSVATGLIGFKTCGKLK
ncbi:MAG: hypothetical protein ACOCZ5_00840 [bacterium]